MAISMQCYFIASIFQTFKWVFLSIGVVRDHSLAQGLAI